MTECLPEPCMTSEIRKSISNSVRGILEIADGCSNTGRTLEIHKIVRVIIHDATAKFEILPVLVRYHPYGRSPGDSIQQWKSDKKGSEG